MLHLFSSVYRKCAIQRLINGPIHTHCSVSSVHTHQNTEKLKLPVSMGCVSLKMHLNRQ